MWEGALIYFTYPLEWTCIDRDYCFIIVYQALNEKLTGEPGTNLNEEQPLDYERWPEFFTEVELNLPDDRLACRLLNLQKRAPRWQYSDDELCASDCSTPQDVSNKIENIINRVLGRVHNDPNIRVMLAARPKLRIHIISPCVKFILLSPARESVLRALGFLSPSYNVETKKIKSSVHFFYYGDFRHPETISDRSPSFQLIKDIYVYTDIVQPSLVSNMLAYLLEVIPVTSTCGENGVHRPLQPHFVCLLGGDLSSIEIRLCKDNKEELPIFQGDVLCQLQFRRVMMARL